MTVINRPSLLSCCITLIHSQIESVTLSRQDRAVDVFHNKCLRRILPIQRQDHVSLRPRCNLILVSKVCETGSIDNLVLGSLRTQRIIENAFRVSFQPDWQINNGFFNRPIMARIQILVHRWRPKTRISALFRR